MKIFDNTGNKTNRGFRNYITESFFNGDEFEFHKNLGGYLPVPVTPLSQKPELLSQFNITVKDESKRFHLKAFKALGASFAIHKFLLRNTGEFIFCTATDGNHGRAVAWAAALNGMRSVVFVPADTDEKIIANIRNEGAEVRITESDYDGAVTAAKTFAVESRAVLIQDTAFDGYTEIPVDIMQGYLTQMRELEIQLPDVVVLQAGVGTWAAAVILYYLMYHPNKLPTFIIAEPEAAACCYDSAVAGKPVKAKGNFKTIMTGLNCGTPSFTAFEILKDHADYFMTISDDYIPKAIELYTKNGIESGQTGASGLAGLIKLSEETELPEGKKNILVFNSEGKV